MSSDDVTAIVFTGVTLGLLGGGTGAVFWSIRFFAARRGRRWAETVAAMGFRLEGVRANEAAGFGVPSGAVHPGRLGVGELGPRRASVFLSARSERRYHDNAHSSGRRVPQTWVCVHLGRSLALNQPDEAQAFVREDGGALLGMMLPAALDEASQALLRDREVDAIVRRFAPMRWKPAVLDRRVVARLERYVFDPQALLHVASALGELADAALAARSRMAPTSADREVAAKWGDTPRRIGLELAASPTRLVGRRSGRSIEVLVESAQPVGKYATTIRVALAAPTDVHVCFDRGTLLPCTAEYMPITATQMGDWSVRSWEGRCPAFSDHPAFTSALSTAPRAALAFVVEDDVLILGALGALNHPDALERAISAAVELAGAVDVAAAQRARTS